MFVEVPMRNSNNRFLISPSPNLRSTEYGNIAPRRTGRPLAEPHTCKFVCDSPTVSLSLPGPFACYRYPARPNVAPSPLLPLARLRPLVQSRLECHSANCINGV